MPENIYNTINYSIQKSSALKEYCIYMLTFVYDKSKLYSKQMIPPIMLRAYFFEVEFSSTLLLKLLTDRLE